jgi:hypothetical protein
MGGRTAEPKNNRYYTLKSKCNAQETPHFAQIGKKDGEWITEVEHNEMFGRIIGASIKVGKDQRGKEIKSFLFIMDDGNEVSNVQVPFSNLGYSLVNTLSSLPDLTGDFTIYVDKVQKDKYWNSRCFIQQNEQKCQWKYNWNDTPKSDPIMVPDPSNQGAMIHLEIDGDKQFDKTKVKAFWEKVFIDEVVPKIVNSQAGKPVAPSAKSFIDEMNEPVQPIENENDPF